MALLDDIGGDTSATKTEPAQAVNSLLSDLGHEGGTDWSGSDSLGATSKPTESAPVTQELGQIGSNIAKQLPRNIIEGIGDIAAIPGEIWDTAFHPEGVEDEPHPMEHMVAEKLADRLEKHLPSLRPKNQGAIERIVGKGIEAAPSALLAGPEAALESIAPVTASGAASQTAAEMGGGPVAQFAAGLSPFAPSALAGATRALVRGGNEGAATMQENLNNAENAGIKLSAGQASENKALRNTESLGAKIPGGGPLAETRGAGLNKQVEESVSNITKKLAPDMQQRQATPTAAGEAIQEGATKRIETLKNETNEAANAMHEHIPKETPFSAPRFEDTIKKITSPTGIQSVDDLVTSSKTKQVAKAAEGVAAENRKSPASYSTDGEGAHMASSPNGETHAVESGSGDIKVTYHDAGKEGTDRLETMAHAATSQGNHLISDISVSPQEASDFEKLVRRGWTVEKNPNAETTERGRIVSDSPKNPVYTIKAPRTKTNLNTGDQEITNNASGESSASQEAINRVAQEKEAGLRRVQIDPDGNTMPLTGVDSVDARAPAGHVIAQIDRDGNYTILDRGGQPANAARGLANRAKARGGFDEKPANANTGAGIEFSYDTKTGRSEPGEIQTPTSTNGREVSPQAVLNKETPWTFDSLRQLRSAIGKEIRPGMSDTRQGQLKQLYGALSEDLKEGVKAKGPEAESAFELFNNVAKTNGDTQRGLVKAIRKAGGPESVFRAAMNGSKDGASKIAPIMGALDKEGKSFFQATVLSRMGKAGGAMDKPFDANTYLNNWRNMSPEAKNVLFGEGAGAGPPTQLRKSLDSLSSTLTLLEKQGYIKSGFVKGVEQGNAGLQKVGIFGALAYLAHSGGGTIAHIAEGHPFLAAGAATGAVGIAAGNPIMSRVLTNPKTTAWLAQATKAPKGMVPVLLTQLDKMGNKDPDAKDLAALIRQAGSPEGSPSQKSPIPSTDTGLSEDRPITNSHKMVPMRSANGATFYGVDPSTL